MHTTPEPIAVIGIGCRFPGGADCPGHLWDLLRSSRDAVVDIPDERWSWKRFYSDDPAAAGKMYVRRAALLRERVDAFDPLFFGISPREASYMDPQQRLLLEVAWEAIEDAGLDAARLAGRPVGVYVGGFTLDAMVLFLNPLNRGLVNTHHTTTAASMTMLANRLSYALDLRGPSIAVDTACSSSLVAIHYACTGIWNGECELALAGGVNVILCPDFMSVMCKGRFLAADGRCKSFDARADGYGRGEGCGIVALKPLAAAQRDGDEIYAVVRGTGVNQDGRTVAIPVPSAEAQHELIRNVYARAGVPLGSVRYVEAHGTGTPVGDPIEAEVLGRAFGQQRAPSDPCVIGSIKANIGHLEAAAGVAGFIKACLCLHHRAIPPQPHFETPNPEIPFDELGLRVPLALESIEDDGPLIAGVNSFGYGGTNAHAVLAEAPPVARGTVETNPPRPFVLPLSAPAEKALSALAASYADALDRDAATVADICFSAATRRTHFEHRIAVVASDRTTLAAALRTYAESGRAPGVMTGSIAEPKPARPVFLMTGMGPQWWAMGRQVLAAEPRCREIAAECDACFSDLAGWSILDALAADESSSRMREPQVVQPANFVLQVALAALWRSWGIEPAAVLGHSAGEIAAAYVAGALGLEDAVRVVFHRSRLQQAAAGKGRMAAVGLSRAEAESLIAEIGDGLSIAAINAPSSVTLSGEPARIAEVTAALDARGVFNRVVHVDVAYHSHHMDPFETAIHDRLADLAPRVPSVPFYSTVTGERVEGPTLDAGYWYRNIRQPVLFARAIDRLIDAQQTVFLEIGPHPVLAPSVKECFAQRNGRAQMIASLRRDESDATSLMRAVAALYVAGIAAEWRTLAPAGVRYARLPHYPWQRARYWVETDLGRADRLGNQEHPLLGSPLAGAAAAWETDLNPNYAPYLVDHVVDGEPVFPASAFVEGALAMSSLVRRADTMSVEDLVFSRPLLVDDRQRTQVQWSFDERSREFQVASRPLAANGDAAGPWTPHAAGRLCAVPPSPPPPVCLEAIQTRCTTEVPPAALYALLRDHRLEYGPTFQRIEAAWQGDREVLARLRPVGDDEDGEAYRLHPALLDAAFHALVATLQPADDQAGAVFVPTGVRRVRSYAKPPVPCWVHGRITRATASAIEADLELFAADGTVAADVQGLQLTAMPKTGDEQDRQLARWTYTFAWEPSDSVPAFADPARWLVFGDDGATAAAIVDHLRTCGGADVVEVLRGDSAQWQHPSRLVIRGGARDDMLTAVERVDGGACRGIIYLWNASGLDDDPVGRDATIDVLHLVQGLSRLPGSEWPRLYIVTAGAHRVEPGDTPIRPGQGALAGFARAVGCEYPDLRSTLIDIDPQDPDGPRWAALEILADAADDDVALRGGNRYVHRLIRTPVTRLEEERSARRRLRGGDGHAFTLEVGTPGVLDSLRYREIDRRLPAAGEVEVAVQAAALNFKDVLKVLGVLPHAVLEHTYHEGRLGMEAAGTIVRVGEGVTDYRVGDRVVGSLRSSFSTHVTTPASTLFAVPGETIDPAAAAGIPVALVTAYYALHHVARLAPGETVLIHAASGGVGLAAIQVARWLGATIHATAGSPDKRAYLAEIGIDHIYDSRTLDFADGILAATGGRGVDVVLNSLSGEAFLKSLAVTAPFGRFIEIGKRDIVEAARMPLLPFNRNLTYAALDLDRLLLDRPELVRTLFEEIRARLAAGDLTPIPVTVFRAAEIAAAFRCMAQARHIGKIVVDFTNVEDVEVQPSPAREVLVRSDASYLVTGAFGALGLEVARWLAAQGARTLVLAGRRGPIGTDAVRTLESLRASGVVVATAAVDVADDVEVRRLLGTIAAEHPPLRGVFHAAGSLDDGLINNLDGDRMAEVFRGKAEGAWLLHRHTSGLPLDHFVLFSSGVGWIGNAGQANYAAANTYLDTLAEYRRGQGLPATSIAWGAFADAGMSAVNEAMQVHLSTFGIKPLPIAAGIGTLSRLLRWDAPSIAVLDLDWAKLRRAHPSGERSSRFMHVFAEAGEDRGALAVGDWRELLQSLPVEARLPRTIEGVRALVAEALRMTPDAIDVHRPLMQLGIDSLIGMELQAAVRNRLGVEVSILQWMKAGTIAGAAVQILQRFNIAYVADAAAPVDESSGAPQPAMVPAVARLSV